MVLADLDIVGQPAARYIITRREKIISVEPNSTSIDDEQLQFDQAIAFPGLINSHDHLDFNLFPPLRNKFYCNYAEWGADIQQKNHDCIQAVLKIPRQLRTEWGIYKNLLMELPR